MAVLTAWYLLLVTPLLIRAKSLDCAQSDPSCGTFDNPPINIRPKFRYWLPDASVNTSILKDDIAQIGERGAAGIEFLNYFNYGGGQGPPPAEVDWNIYGFATEAYLRVLESALEVTQENGLIMDFSMGPQSGQGVPADPHEIGLSWELVTFNVSIEKGYSGLIPGWGSGEFISLSSFDVLNSSIIPSFTRPETNKTQYTISGSSLVDLSSLVTANGSVNISSSSVNATSSTLLFASYARRSYARANIASSDSPQNILQNGSFAVDHFSVEGAKLTTSFLEKYVIQPNSTIMSLLKSVGQYIWEDSVEIPTGIYWTPQLPTNFRTQHGYDLRKYVPFLVGFNGYLLGNNPKIAIVSDMPEHSHFVGDFRTTLTGSYKEYLTYLKNWSSTYLNMQFSAQVGYNLPVDMLSAIPTVDVPETETLSFVNDIDAFRQFSGPAHLSGQKTVSIELGADYGQAYSQPLVTLIEEASRAYAVGINQVVIHGATYSGSYPETTYPGFTTFSYLFAAQHSRHQPAWDLGYSAFLNWLARAQFVLHSGVPKVDVVFWNKQTAQDPLPESLYWDMDLSHAGYSYTYLSPDNFESPEAVVEEALLAPKTMGAKALVLRQNDTLTASGVEKLLEYARAGLPIVIMEGMPHRYSTGNPSEIAAANSKLYSLSEWANVHQLSSSKITNGTSPALASLLSSLDIQPRTKLQTNGTWYTRYLSSTDGSTSVFVFSDTATATEGTITIVASGLPHLLDLWNGNDTRLLEYSLDTESSAFIIPLKIAAKQAIVIQFKNEKSVCSEAHVTESSSVIGGYTFNDQTCSLSAKVHASASATSLTLSNGTTINLDSSTTNIPNAFSLSNWTLIAEKWLPPSNLLDIEGVIKQNITISSLGPEIPSWPSLPRLANSSGIGTYSTTFNWPNASTATESSLIGALLEIPDSKVNQGMSISVNQQELPYADLFKPTMDISPYLKVGQNHVSISVSTTLWNSLRPIWNDLRTGGKKPDLSLEYLLGIPQLAPLGADLPAGLAGTVRILPYALVRVA